MVEQEVPWDSRFPRALSLHTCSLGHPWGWLHRGRGTGAPPWVEPST